MTLAISAEYTSPSESRSFTVPLDTNAGSTHIEQLTGAIKSIQADLNKYLTERMAASNESADLSKDKDAGEEEEDDYDENENNEDTLQRRPDLVPESMIKKQKTA